MKKSSKAILISCLSVLPIIPTAAMLSSCGSKNNNLQPDAEWTTSFYDVQTFTSVKDAQDLKDKMQQNTMVNQKPILERICIPLKISLQPGVEVRLVDNKLTETNNSLFFDILVGKNLDDNNTLTTTRYSCAITDINNDKNNKYTNNSIDNKVFPAQTGNQLPTIIEMEEKPETLKGFPVNGMMFNSVKISSNSDMVKSELKSWEKTYTITDQDNKKSNLSSDLDYVVKSVFINNFKDWKIPLDFFSDFKPFSTIKITPKPKNAADFEVIMQIQNNANDKKTFNFFGNNVELNKNETLSISVSAANVANTDILSVDKQGNVCLNIKKVTIKYAKNNSQPTTLSNQVLSGKSYSINKTFNNIASENNQYNKTTQSKFDEIFNNAGNKLSETQMKKTIEESIRKEVELKKQETLINLEIMEKFAIPSFKTPDQYGKFDVDGNKIYSLYDLMSNLGEPIGRWYRMRNMEGVAIFFESIFSGEPLYKTFHHLFPTLVKFLRSFNIVALNDIVDFLEQSLTVNGEPKTLQQFKDFFLNINNLKEVVKPLLQNSGAFSGYQIYIILGLIDTLGSPIEQSLWQWLSNNFKKVTEIINMFLNVSTLDQSAKNFLIALHSGNLNNIISNISGIVPTLLYTISNLGKITVDYNGKKDVNWMMDVDLYDLFERKNNLKINNPPYLLQALFPQSRDVDQIIQNLLNKIRPILNTIKGLSPGTIDLALGAVGGITSIPQNIRDLIKNNKKFIKSLLLSLRSLNLGPVEDDAVLTTITVMFKQINRFLAGWGNIGSMNNIWRDAFKGFFVPKTIDGKPNTEKTILDLFREKDAQKQLYSIDKFTWSPIAAEKAIPSSLNQKLSFTVNIPTLTYQYLSTTHSGSTFTKNQTVDKNISNVTYDYYFSNSSPIPTVNPQNLNVSWNIGNYKKTTGIESYLFCIKPESFTQSFLETNQVLASNQTYFSDYDPNVLDDNYMLEAGKFNNLVGQPVLQISQKDLFKLNVTSGTDEIYLLKPTAYTKLLKDMVGKSTKINFDWNTIKPNIYIQKSGTTWTANLKSPSKFYEKGSMLFSDTVSFKVKVNNK